MRQMQTKKNSFLQGIIGNIKGRKSIYDSKLKDVLGYRDSAITTINSTPIDNTDTYAKIQSCISSNTKITQ